MKFKIAIICFIFSSSLYAADSIDSLKQLLLTDRADTTKVIHLNTLCRECQNMGNFTGALQYGNEAIQLAKQLNFKKGIASSYNNFGIIYFQQRVYDKALENFTKALKIREELGYKLDLASSYNNLGLVYWNQGNYTLALKNHLAALKAYDEVGDKIRVIGAYNNIGSTYYNLGNYDKALENYFAAIKMQERLTEKTGQKSDLYSMAASYDGIGGVLFAEKNYKKALEYYKKLLDAVQILKRKDKEVIALNSIGTVYMNLEKNDSSLYFHNKALSLAIQEADSINIASSLTDIGQIYSKAKEYDKAMQAMEKAYIILKTSNNKVWIGELLNDIGAILTEQKKYAESISYLKDAMNLLKQTGNKNKIKDIYYNLARAYEETGDYKNALESYKQQALYKDSLFNSDMLTRTADMQAKYETEKHEKEIAAQKERIEEQRFQLIVLLVLAASAIIIILLTSFLFYNRHRNKQKAMLDKMLLDEQKMRIKAIIDAQEEDRKRIAKDLHDSVGQLLFILKMNLEKTGKEVESCLSPSGMNNIKETVKVLDEANIELRNIALKMMPRTLNETGISGAINDSLDKTLRHTAIKYNFETSTANKKLDEFIEIGVFRIFQEILSNIIKHAGATEINVQLHIAGTQLIVIIENNGKEFNFDIKTAKAHIPKTGNTGMGLLNIAIRAEALNGTVLYEASPTKGTITTIRVPIIKKNL
jgi:signal transduction histidine kinase